MRHRFLTADVFTDRPFGGNPLAVFPDASGLGTAQMKAVAREFNLSETVFVLPPDDPEHTKRLRIFTPGRELPFAGHPTIGTAYVLAATGLLPLSGSETRIVFEEGAGPVPVTLRCRGGIPCFAQLTAPRIPEMSPGPPVEALADLLSLAPEDFSPDLPPELASFGVHFLILPLSDRAALGRARVRLDRWDALYPQQSAEHGPEHGPELYLITRDPGLPEAEIRARMFGPGVGIHEDPATGAGVTALGAYLGARDREPHGTRHWLVEQGFEMGRPSLLHLEVDRQGGRVAAIRVGGAAVLLSEGTMEIPEIPG